jgi:hypothetical protein
MPILPPTPSRSSPKRLRSRARAAPSGDKDEACATDAATHHQLPVQVRQAIERNARIPVMLEVIADIARQEKDRLKPGGDGGAGNRVLLFSRPLRLQGLEQFGLNERSPPEEPWLI